MKATREHKIKRSDLRSILGTPTQKAPLFLHNDKKRNWKVGSLNSNHLKSRILICAHCNNTRTQPHDRAWEQMSDKLRARIKNGSIGNFVHANRIFRYDTARMMRNVHLYFVKIFGCHIVENSIPIDISTFADAILNEKACPYVYLKFYRETPLIDTTMADVSDILTKQIDEKCISASWFYGIDGLVINVIFIADGEKCEGQKNAWHPKFGSNRLVIADFS